MLVVIMQVFLNSNIVSNEIVLFVHFLKYGNILSLICLNKTVDNVPVLFSSDKVKTRIHRFVSVLFGPSDSLTMFTVNQGIRNKQLLHR